MPTFIKLKKHLRIIILALAILVVGVASVIIFSLTRPGKKNTCPTLLPPVETSRVIAVLYPGQLRGGDFKAHGGFRMEGDKNDGVIVKAPQAAKLTAAGRYIEMGEVQYILDFKTTCGLDYRFDHLLTLAPRFQVIADKLPAAVEGRSNTHDLRPAINIETGETIATAVGFRHGDHGPNVSFDFGVYDRGVKNEVSQDPAWAAGHKQQSNWQAEHGLCWLDLLPPQGSVKLKALPAGDYQSGKSSDYCH